MRGLRPVKIKQDDVTSSPNGLAFDTFGRLWGVNLIYDLKADVELGAYIFEISTVDASYSSGARINGGASGDLAFDPDTGLGYITSLFGGEIFTFDTATGAIAKIGNPVSSATRLTGLAFLSSDPATVPEPSNLIILGLFGILSARKRIL
jgi:secreted PhoX family phosphatase